MRFAVLLLNAGRGSGEIARLQSRHLVQKGHAVHFMHPGVGEGVPGADNRDIVLPSPVIPVHEHLPSAARDQKAVSDMSFEEAWAYLPAYENALQAVIENVDVVIGHHANLSGVAASRVARRHRKPYVLFLHGTGIEPRHNGRYDERIWALIEEAVKKADGILVTTDYVRDELVRSLIPLPPSRFLVLPCGVDLEEFRPGSDPSVLNKYELPNLYVICPGALTHSKGPQNVVRASQEYVDLAPTIFIGDGELRDQLLEDLGDRGRFLGFVPAEDKAGLIRSAALLVAAPEKREHFGIIYAEALAAGVPPVAYEGGGVSAVVTPGTGILTRRNPRDLGQAVCSLLEDVKLRTAMSRAARTRAESCFDSRELGRQFEDWLFRVHADHRARVPG